MKRDFDLIRDVLLQIEGAPSDFNAQSMTVDGFTDDLVMYNVGLLIDSGYINGKITPSKNGPAVHIGNLTNHGHNLLDSIRDKTFFEKVKTYTKEKGVPLTFDTIKLAVPIIIKALLG